MEYNLKEEGLRIDTYAKGDKQQLLKPKEIDCIQVKKVYKECAHSQVEEVIIEFDVETNADELTARCGFVRVLEESCTVIKEGLVKVKATLEAICTLNGVEESEEFTVEKLFRLDRAGEKGLDVQCQIFPECLLCFVSGEEEEEEEIIVLVTACVGILILVKLVAPVQLLVPTFGFCPEPPECEQVLAECPDFNPPWPPYPTQDE